MSKESKPSIILKLWVDCTLHCLNKIKFHKSASRQHALKYILNSGIICQNQVRQTFKTAYTLLHDYVLMRLRGWVRA